MSDGSAAEHTLLLVEEADSDDPDIYQVVQLEHPPDSKQVQAVEDAMRELVSEAKDETGEPHRFVKESGPPPQVQRDYTSHQLRQEMRGFAADGGVTDGASSGGSGTAPDTGADTAEDAGDDGADDRPDDEATDEWSRDTHVGPIIFSNEQARTQLLEEGEVYTFRADERTTGETWARASRTGPKIADVVVEEVCAIPAPRPTDLQDEWAANSGFGSRSAWWEAIEDLHGTPQSGVVYRCELVETTDIGDKDYVTDGGMELTAVEHTDRGDQSKAQRWETALRLSRGEICLKWPAGQLLCPHYATWAEDAEDNLKVYVPQGGGKIVTGDSAARMIAGGLTNKHATLLNRRETPFEERESDE